jgi:hypothetical protein
MHPIIQERVITARSELLSSFPDYAAQYDMLSELLQLMPFTVFSVARLPLATLSTHFANLRKVILPAAQARRLFGALLTSFPPLAEAIVMLQRAPDQQHPATQKSSNKAITAANRECVFAACRNVLRQVAAEETDLSIRAVLAVGAFLMCGCHGCDRALAKNCFAVLWIDAVMQMDQGEPCADAFG